MEVTSPASNFGVRGDHIDGLIDRRIFIEVGAVPIRNPFVNIASHVEDPIGRGPRGAAIDLGGRARRGRMIAPNRAFESRRLVAPVAGTGDRP